MVSVPPIITKRPPWRITKRTSDDVELPCSAEGSPPPVVSFAKITGDETAWRYATLDRRIHYDKETFSFIVRDLKVEDSGHYACVAKSIAGKINATIELVVIGMHNIFNTLSDKTKSDKTD